MDPSSDTSPILERERRWSKPAGIAAIVGALAVQAGFIVGTSALSGDGSAERLIEASSGDSDGQLLAGAVIAGVAFALLAVPLAYLFLAARARAAKMLTGLLVVGALGALAVGAGLVINYDSYLKAADDFAATEAEREAAPADEPQGEAPAEQNGSAGQGGQGGQAAAPEQEGNADETTVEPTTTTTETREDDDEGDEEDEDDRAQDALNDAAGASTAQLLVRGGSLGLGIGLFYASLWAMRTGLLTRFWGSLGMAAAVVLALFFLYFFALVWFVALGFLILGLWFGGRPPAWQTGTAVPWPKPGEGPPGEDEDDGTIEGEGRELGGPDAPGPDGPPSAPGPDAPPPRKRKRRG